jgi:hypothetical protein
MTKIYSTNKVDGVYYEFTTIQNRPFVVFCTKEHFETGFCQLYPLLMYSVFEALRDFKEGLDELDQIKNSKNN